MQGDVAVDGEPGTLEKKSWPLNTWGKSLSRLTRVYSPPKRKMCATVDPAYGVHEVVVVLGLELIRGRSGADLKASGAELREFVNGVGNVVGGTVDAEVGGGDRGDIFQAVLDADVAEAEFVHEGGSEEMRFAETEEAAGDG